MLNRKLLRILLCLMTAVMVLFAFSGCGDSTADEEDGESVSSSDETPTESETKSGAYDVTLGLSDGDTYVSRDDYYLLGDYFYTESYRIETTDGIVTELGLDMYLSYDEDDGYSDPDGVLAVYYDEEGVMTGYEAYVGLNPVRQMVSYQIGTASSYYTSMCLDSDGNTTEAVWENYVYYSDTGVTNYYTGSETYYEDGSTERSYQEEYIVSDDGTLTLSKTTTKEYDEDGNVTTDETVEY